MLDRTDFVRRQRGEIEARAIALERHILRPYRDIEAFLVLHLEPLAVDAERAVGADVDRRHLAPLEKGMPSRRRGFALFGERQRAAVRTRASDLEAFVVGG